MKFATVCEFTSEETTFFLALWEILLKFVVNRLMTCPYDFVLVFIAATPSTPIHDLQVFILYKFCRHPPPTPSGKSNILWRILHPLLSTAGVFPQTIVFVKCYKLVHLIKDMC